MDVLEGERRGLGDDDLADVAIGPCLPLPRLLYGSREDDREGGRTKAAPDGFEDGDFVTLRYRWHSLPDNRVNKYQKAMVDVSRVTMAELAGQAEK